MASQNFSVADLGNGSTFELFADDDTHRHEPGLDMLVPIVVYSVMFVVGTAGNVTVFASLLRTKRRSRVTILLTHLTTADLIVTFFMIPMEIMWRVTNEWKAGNLMCKVFMGIRAFGPYLSSNILVCISLDRFFVIVYPLRIGDAYRRGKTMLAIAWAFSFVCAFPQTIIFKVLQHPTNPDFHQCVTFGSFSSEIQETLYNLFCIAAIYLVPLAVIIFCYTCLIWKLWRTSKENEEDYNTLRAESKATERVRLRKSDLTTITRAKSRTLKMTVTIVAAFIWCWTPYVVMTLWYMFDRSSAQNVDKQLQEILFLMAVANSCVNPLVYGSYAINLKADGWCFGSGNCCQSSPERRINLQKLKQVVSDWPILGYLESLLSVTMILYSVLIVFIWRIHTSRRRKFLCLRFNQQDMRRGTGREGVLGVVGSSEGSTSDFRPLPQVNVPLRGGAPPSSAMSHTSEAPNSKVKSSWSELSRTF